MKRQITLLIIATGWLAGCAKEPPPRSVTEFMDNPNLLEAAMVRCSQDRSATRYDEECINAREAVGRIEAKEEAARRAEFDASSEQKRQALRRTQSAAAAARQRRADAEKQRVEAEYLAQFGVPSPVDQNAQENTELGNTPQVIIPDAQADARADAQDAPVNSDAASASSDSTAMPSTAEPAADLPEEPGSDLNAVRDELRRRSEEDGT